MAKARAIVKRRKAVRNIRKITKTMQMIATAKFQKSLKRAVGTKPYSAEGARAGAASWRRPSAMSSIRCCASPSEPIAPTASRCWSSPATAGWRGRTTAACCGRPTHFIREQAAAGNTIDLYVAGKKGINFFNFQKRPITQRVDVSDQPRFCRSRAAGRPFHPASSPSGNVDAVYVAYMNFHQRRLAEAGRDDAAAAGGRGSCRLRRAGQASAEAASKQAVYEFSPDPITLLDELLPLTVRTALFQAFLDATTSEHVARMVAMKSATDNADKMVKSPDHAIQPRPPEPDHDRAFRNHGWRRSDERLVIAHMQSA